jgi:hypothetical protein
MKDQFRAPIPLHQETSVLVELELEAVFVDATAGRLKPITGQIPKAFGAQGFSLVPCTLRLELR